VFIEIGLVARALAGRRVPDGHTSLLGGAETVRLFPGHPRLGGGPRLGQGQALVVRFTSRDTAQCLYVHRNGDATVSA
jgi:hypothetical protein